MFWSHPKPCDSMTTGPVAPSGDDDVVAGPHVHRHILARVMHAAERR